MLLGSTPKNSGYRDITPEYAPKDGVQRGTGGNKYFNGGGDFLSLFPYMPPRT